MHDAFFAYAAFVELVALVVLSIVFANQLRRQKEEAELAIEGHAEDARLWKEAYEAKAAQAENYLGQIAVLTPVDGGRGPVAYTGHILRGPA